MFKKACKKKQKLRLLLEGASGSGKTYSALLIAKAMGKKIAVIDTEKGSASLYDKLVDFDTCEITPPFTPEKYINAIKEAEQQGYDVLIIDSITHEWSGKGGCLELQASLGGRYQDWAKVTPRHNAFIDAILQSNLHIIATARTKTDYETTNNNGKMKVEKVGLKTEQRDGLDFEFTLVFRLNENHIASATKDRTNLFNGQEAVIDENFGTTLLDWLNDGETVSETKPVDDTVIYEKVSQCQTVEELEALWKAEHKNVSDEEIFKNLCASRKSVILEELEKLQAKLEEDELTQDLIYKED